MKLASSGFSLMELMIGGAILAGIGLTGAQLVKGQKKVQSKIDHDLELDLLHGKISDLFTDNAKDCDATFRTKYNSTSLAAITQIRKCVDGCNPELPASSVNNSTAQVIYATGASSPHLVDKRNLWYIESFGALQPQGGVQRTNLVIMPINYVNRQTQRRVTKFVTIAMRFDSSGRFMQCVDGKTSNVHNLEKEMCNAVTLTSGGVTRRGVWNGETQKCTYVAHTCPVGFVYVGVPGTNSSTWPCRAPSNITQSPFISGDSTTGVRDWLPYTNTATTCLITTYHVSRIRLMATDGNRVTLQCY